MTSEGSIFWARYDINSNFQAAGQDAGIYRSLEQRGSRSFAITTRTSSKYASSCLCFCEELNDVNGCHKDLYFEEILALRNHEN